MAEVDYSEDFEQKTPPLSVTIKAILERYPDGQIFKVVVAIVYNYLYMHSYDINVKVFLLI